jgi:hypothetical protein
MKPLAYVTLLAVPLLLSGCGKLPEQKTVDVPFTSQAPEGNWSEPWQNACEETSVYMVSSFYKDDEIKRAEAVKQIKEIFAVKNKEFQVSHDESLETISELIKALDLPFTTKIVLDPKVDDLKGQLVKDRPVIVPVFAPALGTYKDGPDYHVMVLVGYDDKTGEFIVNDPGSSSGQGLRYKYDKFMNAIHDLDQTKYTNGKKAVLFTEEKGWDSFLKF